MLDRLVFRFFADSVELEVQLLLGFAAVVATSCSPWEEDFSFCAAAAAAAKAE